MSKDIFYGDARSSFFLHLQGHPFPRSGTVSNRVFVNDPATTFQRHVFAARYAVNFGSSGNQNSRPATYRELYL